MKKIYDTSQKKKLNAILLTLLLVLCSTASVLNASAQNTVQVGTGTTSTLYGPIYIYSATSASKYSYSMTIYSKNDIVAAGGTAGLINQISWNKLNTGAYTTNDASYEVFMKHTTATGFTTASDLTTELSGATAVYSSTSTSLTATAGWVDFPLSTPFNWNGNDNLMVLTRFSRPGNATGEVRWAASNAANSIKMSFSSAGTYTSHYIYANRPNIKLRITQATGIAETINKINLALWPNPTLNELYLNFDLSHPHAAVQVTISDLSGKKVLQDDFTSSESHVNRQYNLSGIKTGLYIVQVKTPDGTFIKKLLRE
jgi:hypothetical protein